MRPNGGCIALWLVLLTSTASGHDLKSSNAGSSFVFNQADDTADAAQDAKMSDLTDSIQGLFSDAPAQSVASKAATKAAQPKATKASNSEVAAPIAKAAVPKPMVATKAIEKVQPKVAKTVAPKLEMKAVSAKPIAKTTGAASKVQQPQLAQTISESRHVKKPEVAKSVKSMKQSVTHKSLQTKVTDSKSKVAPAQVATKHATAQVKTIAQSRPTTVNKISEKPTQPKIEPKVGEVEQTKHVALAAKTAEPVLTKPNAKLQIPEKVQIPEQASQSNTRALVTKVQAAQKAKPVVRKVASHNSNMKLGLSNLSDTAGTNATTVIESNAIGARENNATQAEESNATQAKDSNKTKDTEVAAASLKENNATQEKENKTKEIEDAVVSLPMASLFTEEPKPATNKTQKKFPGNATQKAAWEKKEKALEDEVAALKARLANTNQSEPIGANGSEPIGTNGAELVSGSSPKALMASKVPVEAKASDIAPPKKATKALTEYAVGDATDGTVTNVMFKRVWVNIGAGEDASFINNSPDVKYKVGEHVQLPVQSVDLVTGHVHLQAPAKTKDTERPTSSHRASAQMKKVESVLAVDAKVEEEAMVTDHETSAADATLASAVTVVDENDDIASSSVSSPTPTSSSWWAWMSSFFISPASTASKQAAAPALRKSSFIDVTHKRGLKQDMLRTAQAAKEESEHVIQVNDAWSQMVQDDNVKEDLVRGEDETERKRAETPELPHKPRKDELQGRHGVEMSGFWGKLEKEDYGIEHSVDNEDLGEYERLTTEQNAQVATAAQQVQNDQLTNERNASLRHNDDQRMPIHEPWLRREHRDIATEKEIHDSPDLQMIQLQHHHSHK